MKSLETGDTESIEQERAKLPKTLPAKLEDGYRGPVYKLKKPKTMPVPEELPRRVDWWNDPSEFFTTTPAVSGDTSTAQAANQSIGKGNTSIKKPLTPVKSVEKPISRKEATVSPKTAYTPYTELQFNTIT